MKTTISSRQNPLTMAKVLADGRPALPVDHAVVWAFCDELPKSPPADGAPMALRTSYGSVMDFGELGTVIDASSVNRFGVVADMARDCLPHDDAIRIGEGVLGLEALQVTVPDDWDIAPELDAFGALGTAALSRALRQIITHDVNGQSALRLSPADSVISRAVMGDRLHAYFDLDDVEQDFVRNRNGQPAWFVRRIQHVATGRIIDGIEETRAEEIETDGWSERGQRPLPDAYRKPVLVPDPVDALVCRIEHELWYAALVQLMADLEGALGEFVLLPPAAPMRPWCEVAKPAPRIITDPDAALAERRRQMEALQAYAPRWFAQQQKRAQKAKNKKMRPAA